MIGNWFTSSKNRSESPRKPLPGKRGYLISGQNIYKNFAQNGMVVFDAADYSKISELPLPRSRIRTANIAPDGNLWLGLMGGSTWSDDRVVILDPVGNRLSEIHACPCPSSGIWFYNQRAVIVCRGNGFFATIVEINLPGLAIGRKLQIKISDQQPFMAVASGVSGPYLGVIGLTTGVQESLAYSMLAIVNLDTFSVSGMIDLGAGTNVWSVLPYEGRFYLLNAQGKDDLKRQDIILVTPNDHRIEKTISLQTPSPVWGVIADQFLYSFHNSGWNSILESPDRFLCSTNLNTYQQSCLQLPEGFNSYGMGIVGEIPCITRWGDEGSSGLYCLENGKLEFKIQFASASMVVHSTSK